MVSPSQRACWTDKQDRCSALSVPSECLSVTQALGKGGLAKELSSHYTTAQQHCRFLKSEPFQKAACLPISSCGNESRWDNKAQTRSSKLSGTSKGTKAAADMEGNTRLGLKYRSENIWHGTRGCHSFYWAMQEINREPLLFNLFLHLLSCLDGERLFRWRLQVYWRKHTCQRNPILSTLAERQDTDKLRIKPLRISRASEEKRNFSSLSRKGICVCLWIHKSNGGWSHISL